MIFAFDVDGTLETSGGPVTTAMLQYLARFGEVVIVSPSPHKPEGFKVIADSSREENLKTAGGKERTLRFYVSDNGDSEIARKAGFAYVDREDFASMMRWVEGPP